jgi:hypothetical protein
VGASTLAAIWKLIATARIGDGLGRKGLKQNDADQGDATTNGEQAGKD